MSYRIEARSERRRPRIGLRSAFGLPFLVAGFFAGCARPTTETARFRNHDPSVAYVGGAECAPCHLGVASTYSETGMGRSFDRMTPDKAVEDWSGSSELVIESTGLHYRMIRRGDRFFQRQYRLDAQGRETAIDERELLWLVGSNNHNRTFLVEESGGLFQAPVCWYPQVSRWDLCPGFEGKNDHFAREISKSCLFCHNGAMKLEPGSRNRFERPYPHGIDCERCHGPGQLHVARWSGGETGRGEPDPTIVNPRRLEPAERLNICLQCHLGDAKATERVPRHGRELDAWRPGQSIDELVVAFRYVHETVAEFGLSAQADRMMISRCYLESAGKMDCITCHNPHVSVYHEERPPDLFRRKCLTCHTVESCGAEHASRGATTGLADDCVSCHMRKAEPDDQRHTAFTDHWIRRRVEVTEHDRRTDPAIEPVMAESLKPFDEGERAFYVARANFLLGEDASPRMRETHWDAAERSFEQAIAAGFDAAEAWFFLGKSRMQRGRLDAAIEALQKALERSPDHRDARFALGQCLLARGAADRAAEEFSTLLAKSPGDAMVLAEYGRTRWTQGRHDEAIEIYRRAVASEPWNPLLHLNLGGALASAGRFAESADAGAEAVRLDPDSPAAWNFLTNAAREAGRLEVSREAAWQLEQLQASLRDQR